MLRRKMTEHSPRGRGVSRIPVRRDRGLLRYPSTRARDERARQSRPPRATVFPYHPFRRLQHSPLASRMYKGGKQRRTFRVTIQPSPPFPASSRAHLIFILNPSALGKARRKDSQMVFVVVRIEEQGRCLPLGSSSGINVFVHG